MVVIPAGVDNHGLPFGLQILARRWDDERLLAIAGILNFPPFPNLGHVRKEEQRWQWQPLEIQG